MKVCDTSRAVDLHYPGKGITEIQLHFFFMVVSEKLVIFEQILYTSSQMIIFKLFRHIGMNTHSVTLICFNCYFHEIFHSLNVDQQLVLQLLTHLHSEK